MRLTQRMALVTSLCLTLFAGEQLPAAAPEPLLPPNAFDYYRRAGEVLQQVERLQHFFEPTATPASLDAKRAVVQANAQALAMLREGLGHPCCCPEVKTIDEPMPYLSKFRNLVRLLRVEADVRAADGDWAGAHDSCLDAIKMGTDIQHGALLIGNLVGIACQAIGRKPAWEYLQHLSPAQARHAASRLQEIEAEATPFSSMLQMERDFVVKNLRNFRENPAYFKRVMEANTGEPVEYPMDTFSAASRQILDGALTEYPAYMNKLIALAYTPFGTWKTPTPPKNPLVTVMLIDVRKAGYKALFNQAQNRMLLTSYALRASMTEQGQYPSSLDKLCPTFLREIPRDPFSDRQPLQYRLTKSGYLLYSIGPDAKNDGGKAISEKGAPMVGNDRSTGDIVAGVNGS